MEDFYNKGDTAFDNGDFQGAVKNFRQGAEMGHQRCFSMLLTVYGSGRYNITPKEILNELVHYSAKENIYALLYLGRIRLGKLENVTNPVISSNHAAFASAYSQNDYDSVALVDKAANKAKELYEDKGQNTFDALGIECNLFSEAYSIAERRLNHRMMNLKFNEIKSWANDAGSSHTESADEIWLKENYPSLVHAYELNDVAKGYLEKAIHFIDMAIKWAEKYVPQTKGLLDIFIEKAEAYKGKLRTYKDDPEQRFIVLMTKAQNLFKQHAPVKNTDDLEKCVEATNYAIEAISLIGVSNERMSMGMDYVKNCKEILTNAAVKLQAEYLLSQLED